MIIFFMISPPSCMDLIEKCLFLDSILWRGESGHTEMQAQAGLAYAGPINNQNAVKYSRENAENPNTNSTKLSVIRLWYQVGHEKWHYYFYIASNSTETIPQPK